MSDRLLAHVRNVRTNINWDEDRKEEKEKPNAYMETLVKETSTLHKVLSKHLPEEILLSIMQPVFVVYRKRLIEAYEAVTIRTDIGRVRYDTLLLPCPFILNISLLIPLKEKYLPLY